MIHAAVESKDVSKVKAAIAAGADVNQLDHRGWSALLIASSQAPVDVVKALLDAGARPNNGNGSVVAAAVRRRDEAIFELLVKAGADVNAAPNPDLRPLRIALAHSAKWARLVLGAGATLTDDLVPLLVPLPGTPEEKKALLELAIEKSPAQVLRALIEYVDDASLDTLIPLTVQKGAALAPDDAVSPLHLATALLRPRAVKALMGAGASPDAPLAVEWFVELDDEEPWQKGLTVRELFAQLAERELRGKPGKALKDRLVATAKALGVSLDGSAGPAPQKVSFEGSWVETRRVFRSDDSDSERTERVQKGGTLVLTASAWEAKGALGCGLRGKGKREGQRLLVKGDEPLKTRLVGGLLEVESTPDDEHGLVVTSVFEQEPGPTPAARKKKAATKKR